MVDKFHPIDEVGDVEFSKSLACGESAAALARCQVGMIARDCRENLERNLGVLEALSRRFAAFGVTSYSNDCTDGTEALLDAWRPTFDTTFEYEVLERPHLGGTRDAERTIALASYRNHVKDLMPESDFYLIIDPDMMSIDEERLLAGLGDMIRFGYRAMAAQQLCYVPQLHSSRMINYDAFAWRPDWTWRQDDQRELSFFHDVRPAGAPPYRVNSAFGGACWYYRGYKNGVYDGTGGCEHVAFHRSLRGQPMAVSPNMSVIGFVN